MTFECAKDIRKKADLLPHAHGINRYECDAVFDLNGFDRRRIIITFGENMRSRMFWHTGIFYIHWNIGFAYGRNAQRM